MEKEARLLVFYKELVTGLQKDLRSGSLFFEQAFMSIIVGYEYGVERLCSVEAYEKIALWNLSYNSIETKADEDWNLRNILGPFSLINDNDYYTNRLTNPLSLNREIFMIRQLTDDLETMDTISFTIQLLRIKEENLIAFYQNIAKLKTILRKGWIKRNVQKEYIENDAIHTMQMFALASAYFQVYGRKDFDMKRGFEMIFIHEIGEIIADDIVEGDPKHDTKHVIEHKAIKYIFSLLKNGAYFISLWEEFEERKTEIAKFVYEIDKLDPILKALYLDSALGREDLFAEFYSFEKNRATFEGGYFQELFNFIGKNFLEKTKKQKVRG